jgi:hypothetical protein
MITSKSVGAHSPRLILITPPPVDTHKLLALANAAGMSSPGRTAEHTKLYADACREVGTELGIAVLDLWGIMMEKLGWVEGDLLPGSLDLPQNATLKEFLHDGKQPSGEPKSKPLICCRAAFQPCSIQDLVPGADKADL